MTLRSQHWFGGDDEAGLVHRAAMHAAGVDVRDGDDRPVIGILNSFSELNPCNMPLRRLATAVKQGVWAAGGVAVEVPTISLSEDLMKPTAMLYRNLMAIEVEEAIRAHPLDGVVLLVDPLELEARRSAWRPATARHARGWPALFDRHVLQAPEGADLEFLRPASPEDLAFIDPVVGRS